MTGFLKHWKWMMLAVLLVAGAILSGPGTSADVGPDGTAAARRFLSEMGLEVSRAGTPHASGTFILLKDLREELDSELLLSWVQTGGRLVIADPDSKTLELAGISMEEGVGTLGEVSLLPQCLHPDLIGIGAITVDAADSLLGVSDPSGTFCFVQGKASFAVITQRGEGVLIALGGSSQFRNRLLARQNNAELLYRLAGPGPVVFGPPVPPGGESGRTTLWGSLPDPARVFILQLTVALALFALYRARRFGPPVVDKLPSPIPASELTGAVARIYRRGRHLGHSARVLRKSVAARLSRRLGVSPQDGGDVLIKAISAEARGRSPEEVRDTLAGPDPATDDELIRLARKLESISKEVEGEKV